MSAVLNQNKLKSILEYNPDTGLFVRLKRSGARGIAGDVAGCKNNNGYIVITIDGKLYQSHRLAYLYMTGEWPNNIDHINHSRNDNRWINLRSVTCGENQKNKSKQKNNKTGITGVCWSSRWKNWRAQINGNGKNIAIGHFIDKFEAICARKSAENKYGFHKNHGAA